jgi:diguanylate cyclase (GGDEF)-like protein
MLVADSLLEHLREQDAAGRHGGDEFVLLLRDADTSRAIGVAERIVRAVQRRAGAQHLPHLTLSFGVVQVKEREALEDAILRADQALFEAKRQGRNCAVAAAGDSAHPVFSESQRLGLSAA